MLLLIALGIALGISVVATGIDCIRTRKFGHDSPQYSLVAGVISVFVLTGVNWAILYWSNPVLEGAGWVGAFITNCFFVLIVFGAMDAYDDESLSVTPIVALALIVIMGIGSGLYSVMWYGQDNADIMKSQLQVEMIKSEEGTKTYPETDEQHMGIVTEQPARNQANRVMNQENIGARYELGNGEIQTVNGHLYYVFELHPKDLRATQAASYKVPGYVLVDAEDHNASPELKLGYEITLWSDGFFESNLERHVWQEFPGAYVDDLSLEVDDTGRPFYTAALSQTAVRWEQSIPAAFITVDAQTKEIVQYPLDRIPAWVDRAYSANTARTMLDWWGRWNKAPYQPFVESKNDRYKVAGELNLVYTDEGPAWQALMASWNSDTSVQYVALLDTRSTRVRMYPAPQGLQIESSVVDAFTKSGNNLKSLDPTGLALHKVYGQLVWVGGLVGNDRGGQTDDNGRPTAESFQGVGVLNATSSDAAKVIIGRDKGDAFSQLSTQIATGSNNNSPEATAQTKTIEGIVASVSPPLVFNGNTFMVLSLEGDGDHLYRGQVTETANSLSMTLAKTGDKVILTYVDNNGPIRNIASFKNAALAGIK